MLSDSDHSDDDNWSTTIPSRCISGWNMFRPSIGLGLTPLRNANTILLILMTIMAFS